MGLDLSRELRPPIVSSRPFFSRLVGDARRPLFPGHLKNPPPPSPIAAGFAWKLAGWLALTVYFLLPPREAMSWGLDSSNYGSYAWMLAAGRQFGGDTVAMTGPFGFLAYGHTYSGYLASAYLIGDLLFKAAFGFLAVQVFARLHSGIWRWLWLASLVLFLPSVDDLVYDVAVLLAATVLLVHHGEKKFGPTEAIASLLLGFSILMKGSHATLAGFSLTAVLLEGLLTKTARRAGVAVFLALATFVGGWMAAGQHLGNLAEYFQSILALSSGYNAVMGLDPEPGMLMAGLVIAAAFSLALSLHAFARRPRLPQALIPGFFALIGFLQWKHGFVRADGHVYMFFGFATLLAPLLAMTMWRPDAPAADGRKILWAAVCTGVAFVAAAAATSSFSARRLGELALAVPRKFEGNLRYLAAPGKTKTQRENELQQQRRRAELTDIAQTVGRSSIDFFGYEQGILLLNELNYRPRPMGGGAFNVYHPHLQKLNARFMNDAARRPDFFLFKLQTIDDRLPTADDPLTLEALLRFYQPIKARRDYVLFEKRTSPAEPNPAPTPLGATPFSLGQWIEIPAHADTLLLFALDLDSSFGGFLRNVAYHPSPLFIDVETIGGSVRQSFRVSPLSLRVPVLLSPLLASTSDVIALYGDARSENKIARMRFRALDGGFAPRGSISFFSLPPPTRSGEAAAELTNYLQHPLSNRAPLALDTQPTGITELYGEPITLVHAPGSITFPVAANDQQIVFSFGIMPQAYEPGETDGVEFIVEYLHETQPPQLLFSRLLQPRTAAPDRGMQSARVFFPPQIPAGKVRIRTERGPAGNGAWDQSYVSHVQIKAGPFDPRQVIGFSVPPEAPGFPDPQPALVEGRETRNVPPPAELKFPIPRSSRFVTVGIGVLPAAYQGENHSDGVGCEILVATPDGRAQLLKKQIIDPVHDWRSRGTVTLDLPLPEVPDGSRLVLKIDGGAKEDLRWDWSYVQTVRFR